MSPGMQLAHWLLLVTSPMNAGPSLAKGVNSNRGYQQKPRTQYFRALPTVGKYIVDISCYLLCEYLWWVLNTSAIIHLFINTSAMLNIYYPVSTSAITHIYLLIYSIGLLSCCYSLLASTVHTMYMTKLYCIGLLHIVCSLSLHGMLILFLYLFIFIYNYSERFKLLSLITL